MKRLWFWKNDWNNHDNFHLSDTKYNLKSKQKTNNRNTKRKNICAEWKRQRHDNILYVHKEDNLKPQPPEYSSTDYTLRKLVPNTHK